MNELLGKSLFFIGFLLIVHFLYSLLFLLSKRAGTELFKWLTMDSCLLELLSLPLFTPPYTIASKLYEQFNCLLPGLSFFSIPFCYCVWPSFALQLVHLKQAAKWLIQDKGLRTYTLAHSVYTCKICRAKSVEIVLFIGNSHSLYGMIEP
ncbi:hypothetical protein [Bacillus sp. FJAT-42376]|uniref:hypothetical protein n=1 Tax=Bacillus sp. FJAT-42376 TaxID=2014076 RepID=UPI000F509C8C|nr:hypothetical protein [Bacillus sp. FJAT-42376]